MQLYIPVAVLAQSHDSLPYDLGKENTPFAKEYKRVFRPLENARRPQLQEINIRMMDDKDRRLKEEQAKLARQKALEDKEKQEELEAKLGQEQAKEPPVEKQPITSESKAAPAVQTGGEARGVSQTAPVEEKPRGGIIGNLRSKLRI